MPVYRMPPALQMNANPVLKAGSCAVLAVRRQESC
jgi:hypothetical protein